jgi:hypothetical protein
MPPDPIEQVRHQAVLDEMELLDEILIDIAGACCAPVGRRDYEGGCEAEIAKQPALTDECNRRDDCGAGRADDDGRNDGPVLTGQRFLDPPADLTDVRRAEDDGERRDDGEKQVTPHHARRDGHGDTPPAAVVTGKRRTAKKR